VTRVVHALDYEERSLAVIAKDYGIWDETYKYAKGQNPLYLEESRVMPYMTIWDYVCSLFMTRQEKIISNMA
jgi:hypothetical protein